MEPVTACNPPNLFPLRPRQFVIPTRDRPCARLPFSAPGLSPREEVRHETDLATGPLVGCRRGGGAVLRYADRVDRRSTRLRRGSARLDQPGGGNAAERGTDGARPGGVPVAPGQDGH